MIRLIPSLLFFSALALAKTPVKVVTSLPDLAWAATEIGGPLVQAKALLTGHENPHYVDTVPEYIRLVADADMVCIVGLELEIGWMPKVLTRSGNAGVQVGGRGYCETGKAVTALQRPAGGVDRSMGDVHPMGNPHYWLSPKALAEGATVIRDTLIQLAPEKTADFQKGYQKLKEKLEEIQKTNTKKLAPFFIKNSGPIAIEYHKEFTYFFDAYGISSFGSIEEKPGVPPSSGRIAEVALSAKASGVKVALGGEYAPKRTMERFHELSGIPTLELPTAVQPSGKVKTYPELQAYVVDALLKVSHDTP